MAKKAKNSKVSVNTVAKGKEIEQPKVETIKAAAPKEVKVRFIVSGSESQPKTEHFTDMAVKSYLKGRVSDKSIKVGAIDNATKESVIEWVEKHPEKFAAMQESNKTKVSVEHFKKDVFIIEQ